MTHNQIIAAIAALLAGPDGPSFATLAAGGREAADPVTMEACPRPLPPLDIEGQTATGYKRQAEDLARCLRP